MKRTFRFHTGAAVTARSFADAFNRAADPRMRSGAMNYMHEIAGADAVVKGEAPAISGVRVLAPYRLQIQLTRPLGDLTARLTMIFFCPVLPNTPIDPRGIDNPAGSGPYYIAEAVNQRIVLRRNLSYRGDRPANVDQIVYTVGLDPEACLAAVERDQIDSVPRGRPPSRAVRIARAERYGINRPNGRYFVAPVLRRLPSPTTTTGPRSTGRRFRSRRRSTTRLIGTRWQACSAISAARALTEMPRPRSSAQTASTSITRPISATARKWLRAQRQPREAGLYDQHKPFMRRIAEVSQVQPEADRHRRDGEVLRPAAMAKKVATPGSRSTSCFNPGRSTTQTLPGSSCRCSTVRAFG